MSIEELAEELKERKLTDTPPEEVETYWAEAGRVIKESRVLADAQSSDMLSFQLLHEVEKLDTILTDAMTLYDSFRETINQAVALTRQISNEWHWMERKRTSLAERKEFLQTSIQRISDALKEAKPGSEVQLILSNAQADYRKLFEQIDWILETSETEQKEIFTSKDEALETIDSLLVVIPKKRDALTLISDPDEIEKERNRLIDVLQEALETAKSFKLSKETKAIEEELALLQSSDSV